MASGARRSPWQTASKVLYARTRQEAAAKLRAALHAQEQGTLVTGPTQTVAQFFTRWLEDVVKPNRRPRTYESYEEKLRLHVLPELGRISLAKLTPQHLQRLDASKLAAGLSPKTIGMLHAIVHRGLKQALKWGLVGRNVAELADAPPRQQREPTALSG